MAPAGNFLALEVKPTLLRFAILTGPNSQLGVQKYFLS
jgi:hypothetical protein